MNQSIKKITYTALFIALVFLCTVVIAIPSPLGGYMNIGDAAIYVGSFILGPIFGFIAGGVGSMMGDLYTGWVVYMIPTLIIKGTMGFVSGYLFRKSKDILGLICGFIILVAGYYLADIIILGNFISPIGNVPFNVIQGIVGVIAAYLIIKALKKFNINF